MSKQPANKQRTHLILLSITRTITATSHRMVFPFLPVFARNLGVSLEVMGLIIAARQAIGFISPFLAPIGDIWGRKRAMLLGLGIFITSVSIISIMPSLTSFFIGVLLAGIGKTITDPAVFAFIGDSVSHSNRGTAIAVTEFSWAGAYLIGIPVLGWVISRTNWIAPFPLLASLGLVVTLLVWRMLPSDITIKKAPLTLAKSFQLVRTRPSAVGIIALGPLLSSAHAVVGVVYGVWLEDAFGLSIAAIGASTAVIGIAELMGEGLVAILLTRLGGKKVLAIGIVLNIAAAIALPLSSSSLLAGLLALFSFFISFELCVVTKIPMIIDLVPQAPTTALGIGSSAHRLGAALGILLGPILYRYGLHANSIATVVLDILAILVLIFFVQDAVDLEPVDVLSSKDSTF